MLHEMTLQNFKPFGKPQRIPLAPITLIYGPNSAGKSSVIQALMLIKQTMEGYGPSSRGLNARGRYVDLGSFRSLLHRHELKRPFAISFLYDFALFRGDLPFSRIPDTQKRRVSLVFESTDSTLSEYEDSSELMSVAYELEGDEKLVVELEKSGSEKLTKLETAGGGSFYKWKSDQSWQSLAAYSKKPIYAIKRADVTNEKAKLGEFLKDCHVLATGMLPTRLISVLPSTSSRSSIDYGLYDGLNKFLESFVWDFGNLMNSISYLGPARTYPERHSLIRGGHKRSVGIRGEDLPAVVYNQRTRITKDINRWFKHFEIPYGFRIDSIGNEVTGNLVSLALTDKDLKIDVSTSDVGFGISQLLPVVVEGLMASDRIICVEQPEIHLHPRLQAHVADLMIETSYLGKSPSRGKERKSGNQWIVETHSESIIVRLARRIRHGLLSSEDVCVLYVQPGGKNGSRIKRLRLDEEGEFRDEWPGGFFEESYDDLMESASECPQ
jgi:predicted ATPase